MLKGLNINKSYPCNAANYTRVGWRNIKFIVIHYTGGTGTALANVKYYGSAPNVGASAHYFVGHAKENAQIYQSVDPKDTAWHCGGRAYVHPKCRNSNSIGIETCCHNDTADKSASSREWYFDDETVDRLVELTKALMDEYNIPVENVIRHYDVTHKICPAMWVHDETAWKAFKARLFEKEEELKTGTITASMNGVETNLTTILYKDENYVRLRDLADAQKDDKLTVDWNEAQRKVIIKSK